MKIRINRTVKRSIALIALIFFVFCLTVFMEGLLDEGIKNAKNFQPWAAGIAVSAGILIEYVLTGISEFLHKEN